MKIVFLTPDQFDNFSSAHPMHTSHQTSGYGKLMSNYGYQAIYYGFIDQENTLVGATLILSSEIKRNKKYAYAPRGFLINYDNKESVEEITNIFKSYLKTEGYIFLKIDPPLIANKRDKEGNIIPSNYQNDITPFLIANDYNFFGENKFFGTLKPRWNAILKITGSSKTLFKNFEPNTKNKIRKAISRGVEIVQGTHHDIEIFYAFVAKKHHRKLSYYKKYAEAYGDKFEIYFAKLDSVTYLRNIKQLYEIEYENNERLNRQIQEAAYNKNVSLKLSNTKITSDKLMAIYKKELQIATRLLDKNPNGIIIGANAIIINPNGIELLIEGFNPNYSLYYPSYLLKWHVIEKYAKYGAIYVDLNAITGYFGEKNKYHGLNEMKLGFNADVVEYIGEFDLVINKGKYKRLINSKSFNKQIKKQIK